MSIAEHYVSHRRLIDYVRFSNGVFDAISFECLKHNWPKDNPPGKHNRINVEKKIAMFEMFLEGNPYKEISARYGGSPSKVGTALNCVLMHMRARNRLCKCRYHRWARECDKMVSLADWMWN